MGQYFELVDIDAREEYDHGGGMKLGEFFWSHSIGRLAQLLTCMPSPCAGLGSAIWPRSEPDAPTNPRRGSSRLLSLADELILEIFSKITRLPDAVRLALAHDALGSIGGDRICELLAAELAPWAGHHLICFGDYAEDNDFPPSIQGLVYEQLGVSRESVDPNACSSDFSVLTFDTYRRRRTSSLGQWYSVISNLNRVFESMRLSKADRKRYRRLVDGLESLSVNETYTNEANLVLCNLSRHEYVRGSEVEQMFRGELYLGHVLLSQIGWSADPSTSMGWSSHQSLTRGKWAGDMFEVVKPDEMRPGIEWKDVTGESIAHLGELWSEEDY